MSGGGGLKLAGVCGWPIHHSLSPVIHSYWLREMGISGAYVHFAVRPDGAKRAFRTLLHTSITGVNVTLPLKQIAFDAADEVTPDAEALGASNCLYKHDGRLIAHNTDVEGFSAPLIEHFGVDKIASVPALIIGTGGASRAVIGALLTMGCPEIRLCGRTHDKAMEIVSDIAVPSLYDVTWENRHEMIARSGLIINASAGGMSGKPPLDINLDKAEPGTFIYDLIYTPHMTQLLQDAETRNLPFLGGMEMLIAQARPSFELFYGARPPVDLDPAPLVFEALGQ